MHVLKLPFEVDGFINIFMLTFMRVNSSSKLRYNSWTNFQLKICINLRQNISNDFKIWADFIDNERLSNIFSWWLEDILIFAVRSKGTIAFNKFPDFVSTKYAKLTSLVEGDPKARFSIATKPTCRGGRYFIPKIAPPCSWSSPYKAKC